MIDDYHYTLPSFVLLEHRRMGHDTLNKVKKKALELALTINIRLKNLHNPKDESVIQAQLASLALPLFVDDTYFTSMIKATRTNNPVNQYVNTWQKLYSMQDVRELSDTYKKFLSLNK